MVHQRGHRGHRVDGKFHTDGSEAGGVAIVDIVVVKCGRETVHAVTR